MDIKLRLAQINALVDGGECATCGTITHGAICRYCHKDWQSLEDERIELLKGLMLTRSVNLTQHKCSKEQLTEGLKDISSERIEELRGLLTFNTLPTEGDIERRAHRLALLAEEELANNGVAKNMMRGAMIGGAPYLMGPLERALRDRGITPLYAYSKRVSVEETLPTGEVRKVNTFKHAGFIGV